MPFYSSPVLPVICHHLEMLHIATAAGKQTKLVKRQGGLDSAHISGFFSSWLEEVCPRWSAFACLAQARQAFATSLSHVKHLGEMSKDCVQAVYLNWKVGSWNKSLWALSYKQSWQPGEGDASQITVKIRSSLIHKTDGKEQQHSWRKNTQTNNFFPKKNKKIKKTPPPEECPSLFHVSRVRVQAVLCNSAAHRHPPNNLRLCHTWYTTAGQASQWIPHSLRIWVVLSLKRTASWSSLAWARQELLLGLFQICWSASSCPSLNNWLESKVSIICSCLPEFKIHTGLEINKSRWRRGENKWLL